METVTEKQVLNQEELQTLTALQQDTQQLLLELGEIELIKLQLEERHISAKNKFQEVQKGEISFTNSLHEKYGKINLDPQSGEFIKLDETL
jgi:hypothetical protein|tara:strand:- start:227 stop:499 length:273 start_codon:yes stop_codon:yes gene_type:complete